MVRIPENAVDYYIWGRFNASMQVYALSHPSEMPLHVAVRLSDQCSTVFVAKIAVLCRAIHMPHRAGLVSLFPSFAALEQLVTEWE